MHVRDLVWELGWMGWSEDGGLDALEELGHIRLGRSLRLDYVSMSGRFQLMTGDGIDVFLFSWLLDG